jgi:peptide/nickel transport system permease protein
MGFIRRRIIGTVVTFFVVINLDFILPRLAPGNAAQVLASRSRLPAEALKIISARLGLDQPISVQYLLYLKGIFSWPPYFGVSYIFPSQEVSALIDDRLLWTLLLVGASFFLSFFIGYMIAAASSLRRGGKFEISSTIGSILLWAVPGFWLGMILIWIFGVDLRLLPVSGNINFDFTSFWGFVSSVTIHAILPVVTLSLVLFGQTYFLLRGASQTTLRSDFVIAAEARGLRDRTIAFGYIMRNSLLPMTALLGYSVSSLLSTVVLVEAVFNYPGLGDLIVDAVSGRDYPVLEGSFFYVTVLVLIGALIGDFLALRIDPRVRRS